MFMSRDIMHCKPGKAGELVQKFRQLSEILTSLGYSPLRIYTDVSGENYWTVVTEQDVKSIDEMAELSRKASADPRFGAAMKGYHDLVIDGRRELYKLE